MFRFIVDYFALNRRERNGMMGFVVLLLLLLGVKYYVMFYLRSQINPVMIFKLDSLAGVLTKQGTVTGERQVVDEKVKNRWVYPNKKSTFYHEKKTKSDAIIEINSADSTEWQKLKGIGPGYARRIIKFRDLLGGFCSVDQIKDIYFFPDSVYQMIKNNLQVKPELIKKINVNEADFKSLVHHPYIKYEGAKCIFSLKKKKRISKGDVERSGCFSEEQLKRLEFYLEF